MAFSLKDFKELKNDLRWESKCLENVEFVYRDLLQSFLFHMRSNNLSVLENYSIAVKNQIP